MFEPSRPLTGPLVALFTGPPGSGKSTLADTIGRELPAPVFAWDWLMAPLVGITELKRVFDAGTREAFHDVGYALMVQLVEKQLRNGQPALLDCVARPRLLDSVRETAGAHDTQLRVVECVCSDEVIHRSRVEGRVRAIPGWYELDWDHVRHVRLAYEPLRGEKLVVDAVDDLETNLARVRRYLGDDGP